MFAVWLSVEPVVPLTLPVMVDPTAQTALLEPSGVVQLASNAFSGVERTGHVSILNGYHLILHESSFLILSHRFK